MTGSTHLVIPDMQVAPGTPIDHCTWIGKYIIDRMPDKVINLGDFADMASLSSYDKGRKSMEGRRYKADIEASKIAMTAMMKPLNDYNEQKRRNKEKQYHPELHLLYGNHECLDAATEVLVKGRGWLRYDAVRVGDEVLTLDHFATGQWQPVSAVHTYEYKGMLWGQESRSTSLRCTPNHRIVYTSNGNKSRLMEALADNAPASLDLYVSGTGGPGVDMMDDELRLSAWLCTDSYFHESGSCVLYQRASKADSIRQLLQRNNVSYRERMRDRDIKEICGRKLKKRPEPSVEFYLKPQAALLAKTYSNKRLPAWAYDMNPRQWKIFLDVLVAADGTIPTGAVNSLVFYGRKEICEDVQAVAVVQGWRASITEYRPNQFRVNLCESRTARQENFLTAEHEYSGIVWCLTVPNGNFLIRRNYKCHFTGNSRIDRAVEADAQMDGVISKTDLGYEEFGWTTHEFLDIFEADGVSYSHYFYRPKTGKPYGGAIQTRLKEIGFTFTQGHEQGKLIGAHELANGTVRRGLVVGSCYLYNPTYLGPQANTAWRGVIMKYEVADGNYDLMEVSLDYLCRKYEQCKLDKFMKEKYNVKLC